MSHQSDTEFLDLAVKHEILTKESAEKLYSEASERGMPVERLAALQGKISGPQFDILHAVSSPEDIAPGYRVLSVLGKGGFGVVFRATQINMARDVALKTIPLSRIQNESATKRFEREATIIGQLRHPHIVAAYDFGTHDNRLFLSMELVEGSDLDHILDQVEKIDELNMWYILRQVVAALAYASSLGVTHRDIKPGNLMVSTPPLGYSLPAGVPMIKVTDFGLACFSEGLPQHTKITMANSGLGTPSYVAPEQLSGGQVDSRADIYSLGATAFHMLMGYPPLFDLDPIEAMTKKMSGEIDWLEAMPSFWSSQTKSLIAEMSAFDREDRIQTHELLLAKIDEVTGSLASLSAKSTVVFSDSFEDSDLEDMNMAVSGRNDQAETMEFSQISQLNPTIPTLPVTHTNQEVGTDTKSTSGSPNTSEEGDKFAANPFDTRDEIPTSHGTHKSVGDTVGSANSSRPLRWFLGIAAAVLICVLTWAAISTGLGKKPLAKEIELETATTSNISLFDGFNLDARQKSTGVWSREKDDEGGFVLAGNGSRVFRCNDAAGRPLDYFRFRIGFQFHEASEIQLIVEKDGDEEAQFEEVIVASSEGVTFGRREKKGGRWVGENTTVKIPGGQSGTGYLNLFLERHHNFWRASLDSAEIGRIHDEATADVKIKLVTKGGKAWFENIMLRSLLAPSVLDGDR